MPNAKNAAKKVQTLVDDAQKAATEGYEKITKGFEDVAAFNQDNIDALVKSSGVAVKAAEEMNAEWMSFSKKSMQEGVAAAKEMTSVKSVPEFVEKQADLAKASFDAFVKQSARFNEMYLAAAKDVFAPLSDRASATADMAKNLRA